MQVGRGENWVKPVQDCIDEKLRSAFQNRAYQSVHFMYAHSGAGIKDQAHNTLTNQRLLSGFFSSARALLSSPLSGPLFSSRGPIAPQAGQVLVTLKSGSGGDDAELSQTYFQGSDYMHAIMSLSEVMSI